MVKKIRKIIKEFYYCGPFYSSRNNDYLDICSNGLDEFFDIPEHVKNIYLIITTKYNKNAVKISIKEKYTRHDNSIAKYTFVDNKYVEFTFNVEHFIRCLFYKWKTKTLYCYVEYFE